MLGLGLCISEMTVFRERGIVRWIEWRDIFFFFWTAMTDSFEMPFNVV